MDKKNLAIARLIIDWCGFIVNGQIHYQPRDGSSGEPANKILLIDHLLLAACITLHSPTTGRKKR
jgi:hypothetical protein